jgi:hypothetical protein
MAAPAAKPKLAEKPVPPPAPKPVVVPAGTVLTVRLGEAISSKSAESGQSFSGTLSNSIEVGGKTVLPAGSAVSGTITEAKSAGKFKGGATLALKLDSITAGGHTYDIDTTGVSQESKGKGKRTVGMIGGGAAGGALIGGLAGGGKGAAIGALIGGGAGTAGAGLTGNRDITLGAETALSFKLNTPIPIK